MSAVVGAVLAAVWRVLGVSDDVTECGFCGRVDLARTVALEATDGTGPVVYAGSDCAARALGWTVRDVERAARAGSDAVRFTGGVAPNRRTGHVRSSVM